jgi:hypothetical protein
MSKKRVGSWVFTIVLTLMVIGLVVVGLVIHGIPD